ncbi:psychosine receptor isoform X1 [Ornithorhynchus anatinus]|nr:psychosine receptor isoform X1 [Ornithorhynchus anatinus]
MEEITSTATCKAMGNSTSQLSHSSHCANEQYQLDPYLFPIIYIIVIVISVPANIGSLCVSFRQMKKENELGVYLFSLSLADLLYSVTLPLWIHYTWNEDDWVFGATMCKASAFLMYVNFYSSSAFLTCISVDRYLAIVFPLQFSYLRTRRIAVYVSITVWAIEILFNSKILFENDMYIENCQDATNYTLCYDKYPLEIWQANLNIFRTCTGFGIPLAIMMFCNHKVYRAIVSNQATDNHEKKRIIKLLLSISLTFLLCFTPFHIMLLIRSIGERNNHSFGKHMFKPYRITVALTSLNCIADPILYCFVSETGRSDMWNIFKSCSNKQQHEMCIPKDSSFSRSTKNTELEMEH